MNGHFLITGTERPGAREVLKMCSIMGSTVKIDMGVYLRGFEKTKSRGPDMSRMSETGSGALSFHRLAIMDLDETGMQPFESGGDVCVCNGELYGFRPEKKRLEGMGYTFVSDSDCEIILPLWREYGTKMFGMLDAEYAMIIYDAKTDSYIAARDPIGIRPLYYGYVKQEYIDDAMMFGISDGAGKDSGIIFASEPKNIEGIVDEIKPFPPGHYYKDGKFVCYDDISSLEGNKYAGADTGCCEDDLDTIYQKIHDKLIEGVRKRLDADAPIGFLLSGGLDSSLVCSISQKLMPGKPIRTFAVGMDVDAIDLKYAREVADYIGSEHHEIIITKEDVIGALETVIETLGTYDITTIRASMGMYLMCRAIRETTDVRVLLTGEISDELFGYKYTDFAPSAEAFQQEASKRVHELHMYDVLRADRCISVNGIEARVPFGDLDFVRYVMALDPMKKLNTYGKGKYLLRRAFDEKFGDYLPEDILWREKAAFSDAVGHSMVDDIKEYAGSQYNGSQFRFLCKKYSYHAEPFTKESLLYREIFEKYYPGQAGMVKDFWMPNKEWEGCDVDDPSARVLSNYGASGL